MKQEVLRVGADPFPPYQYLDENGDPVGSDCQRVKELLRKAGYEARVILEEWSVLEQMLYTGELDAVFQVQKTPEREKTYFFSGLLRSTVTETVTGRPSLTLGSLGEVPGKGLTLGIIDQYAYGSEVDSLPASCKRAYPTQEALLNAIADCQVDLGVFDKGVKEYLLERLGGKVYPLENLTFLRPLYIMFRDRNVSERVAAQQA